MRRVSERELKSRTEGNLYSMFEWFSWGLRLRLRTLRCLPFFSSTLRVLATAISHRKGNNCGIILAHFLSPIENRNGGHSSSYISQRTEMKTESSEKFLFLSFPLLLLLARWKSEDRKKGKMARFEFIQPAWWTWTFFSSSSQLHHGWLLVLSGVRLWMWSSEGFFLFIWTCEKNRG